MLSLGPVETGLIVYGAITTYWSLLGAYFLVKTNVVSVRAAPILVVYSIFTWAVSRVTYMIFPEIPPHPVLIMSRLVDSPQGILTTVYVYVKTRVLKIRWMPYILCYTLLLGASRVALYLCRNLPVPEILVLPTLLSGWAGYPAWFYLYVKANKVFKPVTAAALIAYQIVTWVITVYMLFGLGLQYSFISAAQMLMEYPSTVLTLILIDRYRLGNLEPLGA